VVPSFNFIFLAIYDSFAGCGSHILLLPKDFMLNRCCNIKENWIASALLATAVTLLCVGFVDLPVALFVKNNLYANARWSKLTSNLPDFLLMVVLLTTLAAFSIYLVRSKKGIYDEMTCFARLVTWAAPASFATKHFLKFVFGRYNTRRWVHDPTLYGFYWFQRRAGCDGFPSGHMVVVVTLLAALWRFYPRSRPFCLVAGTLLALALVATNYHYVSDVIAGAYLGVLIEAITFRILLHEPSRLGTSAV